MEPVTPTLPDDDVAAIDRLGAIYKELSSELSKMIIGQQRVVELLSIALFSRGHALLMGVPGLAKTLLVSSVAKTLDLSFNRIQFTPDLMPADITGTDIIQDDSAGGKRQFEFIKGPVFANIVLADEINRTSPKTQSALLEVMEEQQVTVDGVTHPVPQPFIVLATQNPGEFVGTYPLPEAQMDRFFLRLSIGYPTIEQEMDVLERYSGVVKPMATLSPVCSAADVIAMQEMVTQIYCSPEVRSYVATIAAATRQDAALQLGASTRAAIALIHGAQACALLAGRDYIVPEDVQHMAVQVLAHRLVLSPEARMKGVTPESVVRRIVQNTPVPVKL